MQQDNSAKKKKKTQEQIWTEKLNSKDSDTVKETIKEIRDFGNIKIIPQLVENFSKQKDPELKKELSKLLSDIKHKEAAGILFDYVLNPDYQHIKKDLLSILWQSRLGFSPFVPQLVDIFINEPLDLAFEAFTVLEYIDKPIDSQIAQQNIDKLKDSLRTIDEHKKYLVIDLVNLLKKWT